MNEKINNSQNKPECCQACGFETEALTLFEAWEMSHHPFTHKWLCGLCAGSNAGRAYEAPELHPMANVLFHVCYVGNVILARLEELERRAANKSPTDAQMDSRK